MVAVPLLRPDGPLGVAAASYKRDRTFTLEQLATMQRAAALWTSEALPADLLPHIRYPQGLFAIQARMFATYHMRDPQVFYNKEDLWAVTRRAIEVRDRDMEPYYTIMRLPGERQAEFIQMRSRPHISIMSTARGGEDFESG